MSTTIYCKSVHVAEGTTQSCAHIHPDGIFDNATQASEDKDYFRIEVNRDECAITHNTVVDSKCVECFVYSCKLFTIQAGYARHIKGFNIV